MGCFGRCFECVSSLFGKKKSGDNESTYLLKGEKKGWEKDNGDSSKTGITEANFKKEDESSIVDDIKDIAEKAENISDELKNGDVLETIEKEVKAAIPLHEDTKDQVGNLMPDTDLEKVAQSTFNHSYTKFKEGEDVKEE